jgi:DNA-binding transcriptional regulator PaaX
MAKVVKKLQRGDITRTILEIAKASGLIATALVAPNVLSTFAKLGIIDLHNRQNEVIRRARNILIKNGCLKRNKQGFLCLTEKGQEKLDSYRLSEYRLLIPRTWDKKWRVLIFDIPEHRKTLRNRIREELIKIHFARIQDSVWIFPYDCEELVALLKADFKVGEDLQYMVVEKIENDDRLRNAFKLN